MVSQYGHTVADIEGGEACVGILRTPAVVQAVVDEAAELAGEILEGFAVELLAADLIAEVAEESEVSVAEVGDETAVDVGLGAADDAAVIVVDGAVAVEVGQFEVAGLEGVAVIVALALLDCVGVEFVDAFLGLDDAVVLVAEEHTHRVALDEHLVA